MNEAGGYDAVVVGAGPNGLVAAVTMALTGRRVLVIEAATAPGGGTRSEALTLPGHVHDVCSAIHPLALASPALRDLPLADHGLEWVQPLAPLAHPLDGGRAAVLERSVDATALAFGDDDGAAYLGLMTPLVADGQMIVDAVLSPLSVPPLRSLPALLRFGPSAASSAERFAHRRFATDEAQALMAGLAAHSVLSLGAPGTAGFGMVLGLLGHLVGWPMARGGSQAIADALVSLLLAHGGEVVVGHPVRTLADVPPAGSILLDLSPRQVLDLGGVRLPARYRRRLNRFRYGAAVCKVDWALDGPIPWAAPGCARAGTVHVGGTAAEVAESEREVQRGRHPERPMVLLAQQSLFDPTRAPAGQHNAWGYCHVPNGSTVDMTDRIEAQIERFAPGFRDRIIARHVMSPAAIEQHDANYVGGDISSGRMDLTQLVTRPVASRSPWRTPVPGLYLCGASTPPGPGVHGMGGWHAAHAALADLGDR
ncbi:MAG: phytoene desaturase family protein [Acidimicrobiales bacterium]